MKKIQRMGELEKKYVNEVIDGQFASKNVYKKVVELEKAFAKKYGIAHAVAMVNGTATLHTCLEAVKVREGDEVICPPLTMSATCFAVLQANAIPVFADVSESTFVITLDAIKKCVTERTKAIITVALYGLSPDMKAIKEYANEKGIYVIEDNAQCFLGKQDGILAGTIGDMASYSFQSSKHITCGEGGIVITNSDELAVRLRKYSGLGYASIGLNKARISKDDIQSPTYERHEVLGWNYRMSDLCGAVALAQVERLDELVEVRKYSANCYEKVIKGCDWLVPQYIPEGYESAFWTYVLKLDIDKVSWQDFRKKFMELGGYGIYGAWQLSYLEPAFKDLNLMGREAYILKYYKENPYKKGLCPVSEYLQPRLLQLKTNFWDGDEAVVQAEILRKTIEFFDGIR